jgi:hypothetical protein
MATTGAWGKSKVTEGTLDPFVVQGIITARNYRIPKAETKPTAQPSEYVAFVIHLERGFGTPSLFF